MRGQPYARRSNLSTLFFCKKNSPQTALTHAWPSAWALGEEQFYDLRLLLDPGQPGIQPLKTMRK